MNSTNWPGSRTLATIAAAAGLLGLAGMAMAHRARVGSELMRLWVRTTADVRYGPYPENRLDLMRPRWPSKDPRPAVLIFHGGGWKTGDRRDMRYRVCRRYLEKGFLIANVEYRLGAMEPAVDDAIAALRWFSRAAPAYGGDPNRLVVTGESAGGHLALLAAFESGVHTAAVVNFYAPTDLAPLIVRPEFREVLPGEDVEAAAVRLSPQTYVRRGLPPVLSVHGTADSMIPVAQTSALTEAIRKAGGEASSLFVEGGAHGFSGPHQDFAYDGVFQFLGRHGIL